MSFSHVHLSFFHLFFFGGCTLSPISVVFPVRVFYTVTSFNEASEDLEFHCYFFYLLLLVALWIFTVTFCCSSVRGEVSDVWVEGQPRPDEASALSCVWKSSGGGGGNSPLVTRQVATGDIQTGGGKLPPRVSGRVGEG